MSALMGVTLWVVARLPGEANWQATAGQAAYDAILGGVSYGGIIVASLAAYFAGEFSNSFVLAKVKIADQRALPVGPHHRLDAGGGGRRHHRLRADRQCVRRLSVGGCAQHHRRELHLQGRRSRCIFTPVTYRIVSFLKRAEGVDYYDVGTDFNPFRLDCMTEPQPADAPESQDELAPPSTEVIDRFFGDSGGKPELPADYRAGFVAVIGRPNVGKSTLINALLGQKVSIVSPKPQTTRNRLLGILTRPDAQIVFLDTPGIHNPQHKLGEVLVETAAAALPDADALLWVVDVSEAPNDEDRKVASIIAASQTRLPLLAGT